MGRRVLVVNPNSTAAVTSGIRDAVNEVIGVEQLDLAFETLADGPPGIETDAHISAVAPLLRVLIRGREPDMDACVVACFSDPGVRELRAVCEKPIYGIGECAYRKAATGGRRFGVVSILADSVPRHRVHVDSLGLSDQLAGDRPLGLSVVELADASRTLERLTTVATALRENDHADAVVLGCAGMAMYRNTLQKRLGCPVIDPCQAAIETLL